MKHRIFGNSVVSFCTKQNTNSWIVILTPLTPLNSLNSELAKPESNMRNFKFSALIFV